MSDDSKLVEAVEELRDEIRELREQNAEAAGERITPRERLRHAYRGDEPAREGSDAA